MNSNKNLGLSDSILAAARQAMSQGSVPLTKVEAELAEAQKKHTMPKTAKEKSLAALATPKDKITHKDVMVGRGVVAKEENEQVSERVITQGTGTSPDPLKARGGIETDLSMGGERAKKATGQLKTAIKSTLKNKEHKKPNLPEQVEQSELFTEEELASIAQAAEQPQAK